MLIRVLPCATQFIDHLDQALRRAPQAQRLTMKQRYFLAFVISAMILTQKLCWATMERRSLGQYTSAALWWMFYRSEIVWHLLLRISVLVIIDRYGLSEGNLLIDDTGRSRCKRTKKIGKTHKIREKKTSGYVNGQELVFLVLQTPLVTIPIDFRFYPDINVTGILADALYGDAHFMDGASSVFSGTQVVSQLRWNQTVIYKNKEVNLKTYFDSYLGPGVKKTLVIRGGKEQKVTVLSGRKAQNRCVAGYYPDSCGVRKSSGEVQEADGVSGRLSSGESIQQAYGRQGTGENDANCLTQVPFA